MLTKSNFKLFLEIIRNEITTILTLNCVAIPKFRVIQFLAEYWEGAPETPAPPHPPLGISTLKWYQKKCTNFVLNCATILKFCADPLLDIFPRKSQPPNCEFSLRNAVKNCVNFVLNCAAIFKFFPRDVPKDPLRAKPPSIANFRFKMVSENCVNFMVNYIAIFKFWAASPSGDIPKETYYS